MKVIRVVAVGLLAAAFLMFHLSIEFFRAWMASSGVHAFVSAVEAISPAEAASTGVGMVAVFVLVFVALGLGLLFGVLVYEPVETRMVSCANRLLSRSVPARQSTSGSGSSSGCPAAKKAGAVVGNVSKIIR